MYFVPNFVKSEGFTVKNKREFELNISEKNIWDNLANEHRPIVLYGMGNGADKILYELSKRHIAVSGVFASDEFASYKKFHDFTVCKYSDIVKKFDDFVILVSFGTRIPEVLKRIKEYSKIHTLYAPDVPLYGSALFTEEFYQEHKDEFEFVYNILADEKSRVVYKDIINYKISGKTEYLFDSFESSKKNIYHDILSLNDNEVFLDIGAYTGDTIKEFTEYTNSKYKHIYALEPDKKSFSRLEKNTSGLKNITLFNIGAWSKKDKLIFENQGNSNSHFSGSGTIIEVQDIDSLIDDKVTLIKMDVEGSEKEVISGCRETIKKFSPKLYVCAYHRNEDLYELPKKILEINENYKIFLRHSPYIPAWESNFYCMP